MLTFDQIKELIDLVRDSRLQGLEIERSGFRLRIDGQRPAVDVSTSSRHPEAASFEALSGAPTAAIDIEQIPAAQEKELEVPEVAGHELNSPIVGTFYSGPSPDAEPFAAVGQVVKKGQVLCIIEAMKLMNEIEADVSGEILAVYPKNAQPVEFGEPLFLIRASG